MSSKRSVTVNQALEHVKKVLEANFDDFSFVGVVVVHDRETGKDLNHSVRFSVYEPHRESMIDALKGAVERLEKGERGSPQTASGPDDPDLVDKVW